MPLEQIYPIIASKLHPNDVAASLHLWERLALSHQIPPRGDNWLIWLLIGGRGCGKTRAGAEWVRAQVADHAKRRIALVAPTYADAREVMLEGESGLLNIGHKSERPSYISSRRRLLWPNGAIGQIFTSEEPDGLRGPQFDCAWADEFCAWHAAEYTLSNLRLGLRLKSDNGDAPRLMITTTPKPIAALKRLLENPRAIVTRAATHANRANLSSAFIAAMEEAYGGTRLGRQELEGEFIEDVPGALWSRAMIDAARLDKDELQKAREDFKAGLGRVIIAIDPPVTSGPNSDACGMIAAGVGRQSQAIILQDATVQGISPNGWAQKAAELYKTWGAEYILAEVNQGGDMIATIIHAIDPHIPVRGVHASKSKTARAHPIAMLYEQGRVKHAGRFSLLEDELCQMGAEGQGGGKSPDRADALVWAVTDLLIGAANPALRRL